MARNRHSLAKFLKRSMGDSTGRSRSEGKKLDVPVRVARIGSACRFGAYMTEATPAVTPWPGMVRATRSNGQPRFGPAKSPFRSVNAFTWSASRSNLSPFLRVASLPLLGAQRDGTRLAAEEVIRLDVQPPSEPIERTRRDASATCFIAL